MSGPLAQLLKRRIADSGPIPVAEFMQQCLGHPTLGYYIRKDPLGRAGDFITSPEISQVFGELIGLWAAVVWQTLGQPDEVVLAELGPGRGTLMSDFLRAAAQVPAFRRSLRIHLVETSPALRERQRSALKGAEVVWVDDARRLPPGPLLLIANEFFDALPIHQYVRRGDAWIERLVGLEGNGFAFVDGPPTVVAAPAAEEGDIFEINQPARDIAGWVGRRLVDEGGAALIVDYGHRRSAVGDTLQAVRRHRPAPVLESPGQADLTAHVDFQALADAARPAVATPVITQGTFLGLLGIGTRAERLMAAAPERAADIASACQRLIDPSGMGNLFKVMAITRPGLPTLPGFVH